MLNLRLYYDSSPVGAILLPHPRTRFSPLGGEGRPGPVVRRQYLPNRDRCAASGGKKMKIKKYKIH